MKANQKVHDTNMLAATVAIQNIFQAAVLVSRKDNTPNQMSCSSVQQSMDSLVMKGIGLSNPISFKHGLHQYLAGNLT